MYFSAQYLYHLIRRARDAVRLPPRGPEGWSKVRTDVSRIVAPFDRLRIKPEYVLRAYIFREGGNSNGFVYAMPAAAAFPPAGECAIDASHFLGPPVPPESAPDVMTAIEGDGSPASFAQASILARELGEFGAGWHGCSWSTHTLLDKDPRRRRSRVSYTGAIEPANWSWLEEPGEDWRPRVELETSVAFTFYTHSPVYRERIIRHTDTYTAPYQFETVHRDIALGPSGIVF